MKALWFLFAALLSVLLLSRSPPRVARAEGIKPLKLSKEALRILTARG
jgi:hypothetical protein